MAVEEYKIYLATSWKNPDHSQIKIILKDRGYEVYDFKNPIEGNSGFSWNQLDLKWEYWSTLDFIENLKKPIAEEHFRFDLNALKECDALIMLAPCGVAAHAEMGYVVGLGKPVAIYINPLLNNPNYPDLMIKMADLITADFKEVLSFLEEKENEHLD